MPTDIVLVTGRVMQKAEHETYLLVEALQQRGVSVDVRPWGDGTDWSAVRLVVVRAPWDYFGHLAQFLAWAGSVDAVTQLVNPVEVLRWNSHKGYLLELAGRRIPTPPTTVLRRGAPPAEQQAALAEMLADDVVIKPAVSVGAIGALRADPGGPQAAAHLAATVADGDTLVQPLERAVLTEGEASLIYFGGTFSHAVRKVPAAGDYRVHDHYGGEVLAHEATRAQRSAAETALAAVPAAVDYARVDLVRLDDPLVMELELIEPELFLHHDITASGRFADHLLQRLGPQGLPDVSRSAR